MKVGGHQLQVSAAVNQVVPLPVNLRPFHRFFDLVVPVYISHLKIRLFKQRAVCALFRFFRKTQICEYHIFRAVGIARHVGCHLLVHLIDPYDLSHADLRRFLIPEAVKLQPVSRLQPVLFRQLFRYHAHAGILPAGHAAFFYCHISRHHIRIHGHIQVADEAYTTHVAALVHIRVLDPLKIHRIHRCDRCRYIITGNPRNCGDLFNIL